MAKAGYIKTLLGGLDAGTRVALGNVFEYVLKNLRFGAAEDQTASENFAGAFYQHTTPATPDTEFTIAHQLGTTPYLLVPVLPLNVVGAKTVRLEVTRAADASRVYLSSPETSAVIRVLIEA